MEDTKHLKKLKLHYTISLVQEIENLLEGSEVIDTGDSLRVVSLGRVLAMTPKTEDPHDDVDRLCGFLYHLIQSGGKLFAPLPTCGCDD